MARLRTEWNPPVEGPRLRRVIGQQLKDQRRLLAIFGSLFLADAILVAMLPWWHWPMLLFPIGPMMAFFLNGTTTRVPGQLSERRDYPHPPNQSAVTVWYRYWGINYGRDVGYASIVDGWLVFDGLKSSFSVRHSDVSKVTSLSPGWLSIRLEGAKGPEVWLHPTGYLRKNPEALELYRGVNNWATVPSNGAGDSQLPPVDPEPRLQDRLLLGGLLSALGFGLGVFASDIPSLLVLGPTLVVGSVIGMVYVGYWASMLRALRRLRGASARKVDVSALNALGSAIEVESTEQHNPLRH